MVYNFLALIIIILGLFVLFSKETMKISVLSFSISLILFSTLVFEGYFLLALIFLTIDVLVKFELFLFLTNKNIIKKKDPFKKKQMIKKITSIFVVALGIGISYVFYEKKVKTEMFEYKHNMDMLIISTIVTLFIISGYVIKSKKWKQ